MNESTMHAMSAGLAAAGVAVFIWASLDYNRFIKFWMIRPAPYSGRVRVGFRLFFLACVCGGICQIATDVPKEQIVRSVPFALGWFAVIVVMIHIVEWMHHRRYTKKSTIPR